MAETTPGPDIKLADLLAEGDIIDFGDISPAVNAHLQQGVAAYYDDRPAAEGHFRAALDEDPTALAPWFCLTKIMTYQGFLDQAAKAAAEALASAARQGNFAADWRLLSQDPPDLWFQAIRNPNSTQRFYAYMLKASAFVSLKADHLDEAEERLDAVGRLDPDDFVGHSVIRSLAQRLRTPDP